MSIEETIRKIVREELDRALKQSSTGSRLLTVKELAAIMNCSQSAAYELTRQVDFPTVRIGGLVRIHRERLKDWIEEHTN